MFNEMAWFAENCFDAPFLFCVSMFMGKQTETMKIRIVELKNVTNAANNLLHDKAQNILRAERGEW